jgi:hypothetical protein
MKKLDARVGDLVEWYDYIDNVVVNMFRKQPFILIYNDDEKHIVFLSSTHTIITAYKYEYVTTLPRKIK